MTCARDFRSPVPRDRGGSVTAAAQTNAAAPGIVIFGHMAGYARAVYARGDRRNYDIAFNHEE